MDKLTDDMVSAARKAGLKPGKRWRGGAVKSRSILLSVVAVSGPLLGLATTSYEFQYDKATKALLGARVQVSASDSKGKGLRPLLAYTAFVYLTTTGSNSWSVPADWNNADNQVECIGPGGNGRSGYGNSTGAGGGGGGGAYATGFNVTLTRGGSASYTIGDGGSQTDTNFASAVIAKAGLNATTRSGASGGQAASCTPTTGAFSGGNGGAGAPGQSVNNNSGGGGGGGAGFSASAGSNGSNGPGPGNGTVLGGPGGAGGSPGGGAGGPENGAGGNGTGWSTPSSAGAGGGGSGGRGIVSNTAGTNTPGSAGGLYGGGGGGGGNRSSNASAGGAGRQGIIRASYTPLKAIQFRSYILG